MSTLFKDIDDLLKKGLQKEAIEIGSKKLMDYNKLLLTLKDKNEKSLREIAESLKSTELTKKIKEIKPSPSRSNSSNSKKMKVELIKLIKTTINDNDKLLRDKMNKIKEIQSKLDAKQTEQRLKKLQGWMGDVSTPFKVAKLQDCDKEIEELKNLLDECERTNKDLNLILTNIAREGQDKYNKARAKNLPAEYASVMTGRSFDYSLKTLQKLLKEKEDLVNRLSKVEEENNKRSRSGVKNSRSRSRSRSRSKSRSGSNKRSRSGSNRSVSHKSSLPVLPENSKGGSKKTKKTRRRKRK